MHDSSLLYLPKQMSRRNGKKTVESHTYFEDYLFVDSEALKREENIIIDTLSDRDKKVALFLTLCRICKGDEIKR